MVEAPGEVENAFLCQHFGVVETVSKPVKPSIQSHSFGSFMAKNILFMIFSTQPYHFYRSYLSVNRRFSQSFKNANFVFTANKNLESATEWTPSEIKWSKFFDEVIQLKRHHPPSTRHTQLNWVNIYVRQEKSRFIFLCVP